MNHRDAERTRLEQNLEQEYRGSRAQVLETELEHGGSGRSWQEAKAVPAPKNLKGRARDF